jgi:hypothetical protein
MKRRIEFKDKEKKVCKVELDEQTKQRANITLKEVKEAMKEQLKEDANTPEKLLRKLAENDLKAVFIATKCPECESIFLHTCVGKDLHFYKNYELWNINWGDHCPKCNAYDALFLQHHTGKVIFDNTGIGDCKLSLLNKETLDYCKTPLISTQKN